MIDDRTKVFSLIIEVEGISTDSVLNRPDITKLIKDCRTISFSIDPDERIKEVTDGVQRNV